MKGLVVKSTTWNGKVCKIGIPNNAVHVHVKIAYGQLGSWCVGGLRMPGEEHLSWEGGELCVGDEIEVVFAEFLQATPPVGCESHDSLKARMAAAVENSEDNRQWKLDRYKELERLLFGKPE